MKVFDSFDIGWQYAKKYGLTISLVLLGCYFLTNMLLTMCIPESFLEQYAGIITSGADPATMIAKIEKLSPEIEAFMPKVMLVSLLSVLVSFGVMNMALSIIIGETKGVSLKYISLPFWTYVKLLSYVFLMYLIMVLSVPTFGILFLFFGVYLIFTVPVLLEQPECQLFSAMRQSWAMTRGNFFQILGFCLIALLVLLIGFLCFFVGVFFAEVVVLFAFLAMYRDKAARLNA